MCRCGGGLLQKIASGSALATLLQISFLTIRHREREGERERAKEKAWRQSNMSLSFVCVAWKSQSVFFASKHLCFFPPFSLLHVQKPVTTTKKRKMDKSKHEQKILAYGSFACGCAQSSHSLLSIPLLRSSCCDCCFHNCFTPAGFSSILCVRRYRR